MDKMCLHRSPVRSQLKEKTLTNICCTSQHSASFLLSCLPLLRSVLTYIAPYGLKIKSCTNLGRFFIICITSFNIIPLLCYIIFFPSQELPANSVLLVYLSATGVFPTGHSDYEGTMPNFGPLIFFTC